MFIIIVGCGRVGARLAQVLENRDNDVVVIDKDSSRFDNLNKTFGGLTIEGNPTDHKTLIKAGIKTADFLISLTTDDNLNIIVCQMAKEIFEVPKVLARIADPAKEDVFNHFGLQTICQTNLVVDVVQRIIEQQNVITEFTLGNSTISLSQIDVDKKFIGKKLNKLSKNHTHILGVVKANIFYFYDPNTIINEGDKIVVLKRID